MRRQHSANAVAQLRWQISAVQLEGLSLRASPISQQLAQALPTTELGKFCATMAQSSRAAAETQQPSGVGTTPCFAHLIRKEEARSPHHGEKSLAFDLDRPWQRAWEDLGRDARHCLQGCDAIRRCCVRIGTALEQRSDDQRGATTPHGGQHRRLQSTRQEHDGCQRVRLYRCAHKVQVVLAQPLVQRGLAAGAPLPQARARSTCCLKLLSPGRWRGRPEPVHVRGRMRSLSLN
mmetsp:Transcript_123332/g.356428  ORF Transcript_123332/g.356428 Transcript_123332/m.356428 type:complete len:234 (-) Transcript_123332:3-704(-)